MMVVELFSGKSVRFTDQRCVHAYITQIQDSRKCELLCKSPQRQMRVSDILLSCSRSGSSDPLLCTFQGKSTKELVHSQDNSL